MIKAEPSYYKDTNSAVNAALSRPSSLVEYGYYFIVAYGVLSASLGLSIEKAAVLMLAFLLLLCFLQLGSRMLTVLHLAALPIGCGISYMLIQLLIHTEPLENSYIRNFVPWMLGLLLIQSLALRKNFLSRFCLATLLIGLGMLPFLSGYNAGGFERVGLDSSVGYGNPNALGA